MKQSEKTLVGVAMLAGGIALIVGLGLPQWDAFNANNGQVASLNDEITQAKSEQARLMANIALLQKNTNIPPGINIRTYTPQTREVVIKQMLDQVVRTASASGNRFISLTPYDASPIMPPPAPAASTNGRAGQNGAQPAANTNSSAPAQNGDASQTQASTPPPILTTHGYQLAVRGTYESLQSFLKAMRAHKELLEIAGIVLENEMDGATQNSGGDASLADPNFPIKLTAKLRLVLQPQP